MRTTSKGLVVWDLSTDSFSHTQLAANWDTLDALFVAGPNTVQVVSSIPGSGLFAGMVLMLSNASGGFPAWTMIRYDGSAWRAVGPFEILPALPVSGNFPGRIVILSAANGGFGAWAIVVYNGSAWNGLPVSGSIANGDISASAAIAYSKLNLSNGIVNSDVSTTASIAYSKLNLTGNILNSDISSSAAIAYAKLNLAGSLVNADVSGSAAIAYSKLNLTGNIVNADISNTAGISGSKLAGFPSDNTKFLAGDGTWIQPGSPTGTITMYAAVVAPTGWLICDGTSYLRSTYPTLFGIIGTTYGAADGSHFNVPNLGGRVPVGFAPVGGHTDVSALGNNEGVVAANRRPKHNTSITDPTHIHNTQYGAAGGGGTTGMPGATGNGFIDQIYSTGAAATGITAGPGGTAAIDTPSYLVLNMIIKT